MDKEIVTTQKELQNFRDTIQELLSELETLQAENKRLRAENERLEELLAVHAQISANRRRLQEAYKLGYADDVMDTSIKLEALDKQVLVLSEALKKGSE